MFYRGRAGLKVRRTGWDDSGNHRAAVRQVPAGLHTQRLQDVSLERDACDFST